jgi:hypothetical protein
MGSQRGSTKRPTGSASAAPRKRKKGRVTRGELLRRLTAAAARGHAAATAALGPDLGPQERTEALVWLYAYLLGGEFAHLTVLTEDPQRAEARLNAALAAGMEEYADFMQAKVPPANAAEAARTITMLNAIARRIAGPFGDGQPPRLEVVGTQPAAAPAAVPDDEEDAIPY